MSPRVFVRILVGWDGSSGATAGLRMALRLTAFDGGHVTALAVVPGYAHVEDLEDRRRAAEDVRGPLRHAYDAVLEADQGQGRKSTLEFVEAVDVATVLDRYAATHPPDLVVVGLHGREGLLHPKMGHIASHAVRSSRCPVLVVPEPGRTAPYPDDHQPGGSKISSLFHPFRHREAETDKQQ